MPQMQGGLFPRNLVKFGAMQPVHKPKQHKKKSESYKQNNTPVKTESHTW